MKAQLKKKKEINWGKNFLAKELLKDLYKRKWINQNIPPLNITAISSYEEYNSYIKKNQKKYLLINSFERSLIPKKANNFLFEGYCYVCKTYVNFLVDFKNAYKVDDILVPNWRETLICPKCGLNNRMRAAIDIFCRKFSPKKNSNIFITEQTTILYKEIKKMFPGIQGSEYLGDSIALGSHNNQGIRNEDLTQLSFDNDKFDYILSFDVFEHIPNYKKALKECYRCLRPGGVLFFSVPFITTSIKNRIRAVLSEEGKIIHLLPPEYHGDPLRPEGCLCFYHFGWELLDEIRALGFEDVKALLYWSIELGYLGGEQIIFAAKKKSK